MDNQSKNDRTNPKLNLLVTWFQTFLYSLSLKVSNQIRWIYINILRIALGQACRVKMTDITVMYKSDNFVVVNKRQDIKVNSDDPVDCITVETQLRKLFPDLVSASATHGFRFCHRLDYATSGALCVAFNKKGARWASKAFRNQYVTKHYLALVRGHVQQDRQDVDIAIGRDSSVSECHKMATTDNPACENPRAASTTIVTLEHGEYDGSPASKILLIPQTGRTHQLRVHCGHVGHLIVGDYTYSNRQDVWPYRMMLHAYRLIIPMKYEHIDVTASDPFVPQVDPKWSVTHVIKKYSDLSDFLKRKTQCSSQGTKKVAEGSGAVAMETNITVTKESDNDCPEFKETLNINETNSGSGFS